MKTLLIVVIALCAVGTANAATTINPTNRYAWGANVGWINMGNGFTPSAGHIRYSNTSPTDFGVNYITDAATLVPPESAQLDAPWP